MDIAIQVPDSDVSEVLSAIEEVWLNDARALDHEYDSLDDADKLAACLVALTQIRTKNRRREAAERALSVPVPDVRRRRDVPGR